MHARRLAAVASAAAFALALALTTTAASMADPRSTEETCATILGSEVCTWAVTEGPDVLELGATIPMALIEAVSSDAEMVWPPKALGSVGLPDAARSALGIDHMEINWEAHGHPPATFLASHFDFHFYNITPDAVRAIDCSDAAKPAALPTRYALPDIAVPGLGTLTGLCVPEMGMHAMPEHEVHATDPFHASMLVGYYGGRPVFFEPMVSREVLLGRSDFTLEMPRVSGLPEGVRYPSAFRAEYDPTSEAYRLVFAGLGKRSS